MVSRWSGDGQCEAFAIIELVVKHECLLFDYKKILWHKNDKAIPGM